MAYFVLMCYGHSISSPLTDFTYKCHRGGGGGGSSIVVVVVVITVIFGQSGHWFFLNILQPTSALKILRINFAGVGKQSSSAFQPVCFFS